MNRKSDNAIKNKTAVILYTVLGSILFLAYILELVKGTKTLPIVLLVEVFDAVPLIACWIIFKRDEDSELIKHVMAIGYAIFYAAVLFTTTERLVFVYCLPMFFILTLYGDFQFSVKVTAGASILAVVQAIWLSSKLGWTDEAIAQTEIQVLVMIVIAVFSAISTKTISMLSDRKVDDINKSSEKTSQMLDSIMLISNEMVDEVNEVSNQMETLANSSDEIYSAMQEVTSGSTETAESIQNQLYKTEEIQTQINRVNGASENIGKNVADAVEAIHEGRDNIGKLLEQANVSEAAGKNAMKEVEELVSFTSQMQQIVELIKSVASQTSLLALNASIEAARAGEAGRGFAVVATEISNLAGQTQTATGNISQLIESLSSEMNDVVDAINSLVESNRIQSESANVTNGSFQKIVESTREIRTSSQELASVVTTLADANQEIVESIQTISAITEEVSAHSNTTCSSSEQNKAIVSDVMKIVDEMLKRASELENIQ